MTDGYSHKLIEDRLEACLVSRGFVVSRQAAATYRHKKGRVDLKVELNNLRLAIEVETTARRVANDLYKAMALDAPLWIVVPNRDVQEAVRRTLQQLGLRESRWLCVYTLAQAMQQLNDLSFLSLEGKKKQKEKEMHAADTSTAHRVANGDKG